MSFRYKYKTRKGAYLQPDEVLASVSLFLLTISLCIKPIAAALIFIPWSTHLFPEYFEKFDKELLRFIYVCEMVFIGLIVVIQALYASWWAAGFSVLSLFCRAPLFMNHV